MKENRIVKNATDVSAVTGVPDDEALSLISRYARKTPSADEIYTFSVILCDNEVDRDNERFSVDALERLCGMFVGVTGISDHSMKSSDQTARIYKTEIIRDNEKITSAGEPYTYIKGWCYMLRTEKTAQLISEIDGGIKKEVSVSCSVAEKICSVCGHDIRSRECTHIQGEAVNGRICHSVLTNPTDAYEWSFVAVPAQRNAGVSKSVKKKNPERKVICSTEPDEIIKSALEVKGEVTLSPAQIRAFADYVKKMKDDAQLGTEKRIQAEDEIIALSAFTLPAADTAMLRKMLGRLSADEVVMLHKAFSDRAERLQSFSAGFTAVKADKINDNSQFRI